MEGCPRSSMLSIDLKESTPIEFSDPLKKYIGDHYQEDAEKYNHECQQLEQLRSTCLHPNYDHSGCSALRRYFAQLQFLQSRFPMIDEGVVSIQYTWIDLYSEESIALADVRFEQAAILHNLGALHSVLGSQEDRTGEEGMKVACTHFQAAAGVFQYLKNTVMVPLASMKLPWVSEDHFGVPFFDLASCVLQLYINILLGQAQECLLEKSILDGRKDSLIARISMQVYDYYQQALGILESLGSSYLGSKKSKMWTKAVKIKAFHFTCVSYIHMSNHAHENQKFGEKVAYLKAAHLKLTEAQKHSKGQPERTLELLQFMADVVSNQLEGAEKDNDFIYHEVVPDLASLPVIKGASLVKPIPFQPCDPSVAGPDIFQRLIPMEAHTDASIYSEEKAKLLRRYNASIETKNKQLVQSLASLHIDDLLQPVETDTLPSLLKEKHESLSKDAVLLSQAEENTKESLKLNDDIENILDNISSLLAEDERKVHLVKEKFGPQETPPEKEEIKTEYEKCQETLHKANQTSNELVRLFNAHKQNLELISGPEDQLLAALPSLNIIDSPVDDGAVQRLRDLLAKVSEMKNQRISLEQSLRNKLNEDDITGLLVTRDDGNKMAFFADQLKKHDPACSLIQANLDAQDKILNALTEANAKYAKTRQAVQENSQRREEVIQALILSYNTFCELQGKIIRGVEFYKRLLTTVTKLEDKCKNFFDNHSKELDKLIGKIKATAEPPKPPSRPLAAKPDHLVRPQQTIIPSLVPASFPPGQSVADPRQHVAMHQPALIPGQLPPHSQGESGPSAGVQIPGQGYSANVPPGSKSNMQQVPHRPLHSPGQVPLQVPGQAPIHPTSQRPIFPVSLPQNHIPVDQTIHSTPRMSYPFPVSQEQMRIQGPGQFTRHNLPGQPVQPGGQASHLQNRVHPSQQSQIPANINTSLSQLRPGSPGQIQTHQQPDLIRAQQPRFSGQQTIRPQFPPQQKQFTVRPQSPQPDLISQVRPPFSRQNMIPPHPSQQIPYPRASTQQTQIGQQQPPLKPQPVPLGPSSLPIPVHPHQVSSSSTSQSSTQPGPQSFVQKQHFQQPPTSRPPQQQQPPVSPQPQQGQQQFRPQQQIRPQFRPEQQSPQQFQPRQPSRMSFPPRHQFNQSFQPGQAFQQPIPPDQSVRQPFQPEQLPGQQSRPLQTHQPPFRPSTPSQQGFRSDLPTQQPFRPDQPPRHPFRPNNPSQQPIRPITPFQQPFRPDKTSNEPFQPTTPSQQPIRPDQPSQQPFRPNAPFQQPFRPDQPSQQHFRPSAPSQQQFRAEQKSQQPFRPNTPFQQPFRPDQQSQQPYRPNTSSQPSFRPESPVNQPSQPFQNSQQPFRSQAPSQQPFRPQMTSQQPQPSQRSGQPPQGMLGPEKQLPMFSRTESSVPIKPDQQFSNQPNRQFQRRPEQMPTSFQVDEQSFVSGHQSELPPRPDTQYMKPQRPEQSYLPKFRPDQKPQEPFCSEQEPSRSIQTDGKPSLGQQPLVEQRAQSYPETGAFVASQPNLTGGYGGQPTPSLLNQGSRPFPNPVTSSDYLTSFSVALAQTQLSQYQSSASSQHQMQQFHQQLLFQQQQIIFQQQEMLRQQSQHHSHDSDQAQIGLLLQQIMQQQKQLTDLEMKVKDKVNHEEGSKKNDDSAKSIKNQEQEEIGHQSDHTAKIEASEKESHGSSSKTVKPIADQSKKDKSLSEESESKPPHSTNSTFLPNYEAAGQGQWFLNLHNFTNEQPDDVKTSTSKNLNENSKNMDNRDADNIDCNESVEASKENEENKEQLQDLDAINLDVKSDKEGGSETKDPDKSDVEVQEDPIEENDIDDEDKSCIDRVIKVEETEEEDDLLDGEDYEVTDRRQEIEEQIKQIKELQKSQQPAAGNVYLYEPGKLPTGVSLHTEPTSTEEDEDKPSLLRQCGHYYETQISSIDQDTNNSCLNDNECLQALVSAVKGFHLVVKSLSNPKHGANADGFSIEWRQLEQLQEHDSASMTAHIAGLNQTKNRYSDVVPWDHTRVKLQTKEDSDYINANFIKNMTPLSPTFIATQGPIATTLTDFWLMVWEQQSQLIVMLTKEVEGNKLMCHQYWPIDEGHSELFGPIRVTLKTLLTSPSSVKRIMHVQHSDTQDTLVVTHLQFTGWPDKGVPESPEELLAFIDDVRSCHQPLKDSDAPIVTHCSAGIGRTGTFIVLYAAMQEFSAHREFVNIPRLVRSLRLQRKYMVQKKEQYEFCYKTVLFYARQFLDLALAAMSKKRIQDQKSTSLSSPEVDNHTDVGEGGPNEKSSEIRFLGELKSDDSIEADEMRGTEKTAKEQSIAEKYCKGTLETDSESSKKTASNGDDLITKSVDDGDSGHEDDTEMSNDDQDKVDKRTEQDKCTVSGYDADVVSIGEHAEVRYIKDDDDQHKKSADVVDTPMPQSTDSNPKTGECETGDDTELNNPKNDIAVQNKTDIKQSKSSETTEIEHLKDNTKLEENIDPIPTDVESKTLNLEKNESTPTENEKSIDQS